ncbi:MAG: YCF48-related protein [Isosphaeraceae bacterium]
MKRLAAFLILALPCTTAAAQWAVQESGTKARFRGLSVVNAQVAWASGNGGTVVMTRDGGKAWNAVPLESNELDCRDIQAFDDRVAVALTIGEGEKSRIYRTEDGGKTWKLAYLNRDPKGFLDAIAFFDPDRGLALGDPIDGRFLLLETQDGGKSWSRIPAETAPVAREGEGAFAASGTCLIARGRDLAWIATGGARTGRVGRSTDRGRTWTFQETPIPAPNPASGVFSIAFLDDRRGVAVGGDYQATGKAEKVAAVTEDGGKTWRPPAGQGPGGYRSAVVVIPGTNKLVAAGPAGCDGSEDGGDRWIPLGDRGFHALGSAGADATWGVGENGLIAKLEAPRLTSPARD